MLKFVASLVSLDDFDLVPFSGAMGHSVGTLSTMNLNTQIDTRTHTHTNAHTHTYIHTNTSKLQMYKPQLVIELLM